MKEVNLVLGKNIQQHRRRQGLTQRQLACLIGVTYQAVSKWERGKGTPDVALLPSIARVLGCSIDELFAG